MAALTVLVTGATGHIGGRLVPRLLAEGHRVRALTRDAQRLRDVPWVDEVEVVEGDVLDPAAAARALAGVDVAYYLVHSTDTGEPEHTDRRAAAVFADAARAAGTGRLVHLGGLVPEGEELSPHLRSRQEVGEVLLASGVPTVVLQAAVILGSGSASFEVLRYLTERLPAMVTPHWRPQPDPADRGPGRAALPRRVRDAAARGVTALRHRRARRPDLRRDDAALRRRREAAPAPDRAAAGAHAAAVRPLGQRRHTGAGGARRAAGPLARQHRRVHRARHRRARPRPSGGAAGLRRRRPARAAAGA